MTDAGYVDVPELVWEELAEVSMLDTHVYPSVVTHAIACALVY